MYHSHPNQKGQTLIGILISLALLVILAQALFTLTNTSYQLVGFNRSRIAARHLAQEKIELIRNLPYDLVGTVGGIPSGTLSQSETVNRNGLTYTIRTSVVYIDDPFDNTAPLDLLPVDYKRVRVDVSWDGLTPSRNGPIVLATDIAPQGIETTAGGGTLSILVFDANAEPVPQADVTIQASGVTPAIDLELQTNDNGRIILPGAPICTACYSISVTKEGFSSDKTYTTTEVTNPTRPLQTILEGAVTEISFAIDQTSTLTITTLTDRESGFSVRPNTPFFLRGEKIIGTDIDDLPVYKYSEYFTTDELGSLEVPDLEWDNYDIILLEADTITLAGSNPLLPYSLLPNVDESLSVALADKSLHSLLAIYTNGTDPVASVSATLSLTPDFTESKFTGGTNDPDYGQVFFGNLNPTSYTLSATASGYVNSSGTITVSGNTTTSTLINAQ